MASLFCCCCTPCCNELSDACSKFIGPRKMTQISYVSMIVFFLLPVVLLTFIFQQLNSLSSLTFGFVNIQTPTYS